MSTAHSIALGILMGIGLLSVVGFIQLLMLPFDIAARVFIGAADVTLWASEVDRVNRKQMKVRSAKELLRRQMKEVQDGRG